MEYCGDTYRHYCLRRVHPHVKGCGGDVLPTIIHGPWDDGHRFIRGGGEDTSAAARCLIGVKQVNKNLLDYFRGAEGRQKTMTVEALLFYWLWHFILPSGPRDGINTYVFPLTILLTEGKKLPQEPLHLKTLYAWLDECAIPATLSEAL